MPTFSYTQLTNFQPKDLLPPNDSDKVILGAEMDPEFTAISAAYNPKYDIGDLASTAQAEAGALNTVLITPSGLTDWSGANGSIIADIWSLPVPGQDEVLFYDVSQGFATGAIPALGLTMFSTALIMDLTNLPLFASTIDSANDMLVMYDDTAGLHYKVPINEVTSSDSGFVLDSRTISAGTGIGTGLGDLTANRTVNLDTTSPLNDDHSAISVTAGTGLTGGGTIDANSTINVGAGEGISVAANTVDLDVDGLTGTDAEDLLQDDAFVYYNGVNHRKIEIQDMGLRVVTFVASKTLALTEANTLQLQTNATGGYNVTIPPNASVAFPIGVAVIISAQDPAATDPVHLLEGAGVTINAAIGTGDADLLQGGTCVLIKVATNVWQVAGDVVLP